MNKLQEARQKYLEYIVDSGVKSAPNDYIIELKKVNSEMLDWMIEYVRPKYEVFKNHPGWEYWKKSNSAIISILEKATGLKIEDAIKQKDK